MSKAVLPHFHHRLLRRIGTEFCGVKGVDWLLRQAHSPDCRSHWYLQAEVKALWDGPTFHLETRWFTEWQTYFYGSQDRGIHRWVKDNLKKDWTCFDVGTNFGFFACLCAQLSREAHGFEPVSSLLLRAERNRALNGLNNLCINGVALSNKLGIVSFHLPIANSPNWGTGSLVHNQNGGTMEVESTTLDCYCEARKVKRLDFMKIDVEGAEHLVLQGGVETIGRFRPTIIFENNFDSRDAAFRILQSLNYSFYSLSGQALASDGVAINQLSDILARPG